MSRNKIVFVSPQERRCSVLSLRDTQLYHCLALQCMFYMCLLAPPLENKLHEGRDLDFQG